MKQRRVVRPVGRASYGRPQPMRPPRRRRMLPRALGLIPRRVMVLLLVACGAVLLLQQGFRIKAVEVKSSARASEIETKAQELLRSNWRQQNLLTLNSTALASDLARKDPMIKIAAVHRRWPQGLELVITLKQPSLGWMSGNQAYLLDRDGSAIGLLPVSMAMPVVVDGSNLPVELGQRVTTGRFVAFTTELATALAGMKVSATRYEVKETTLDLYVKTTKGYQLIFDTSRPAAQQASDLSTLLTFLNKQGKAPAEYIDLRIAGKAYYK